MNSFENFDLAVYLLASSIQKMSMEDLQDGIDFYQSHTHLDKVYIENHCGTADIPVRKLKEVKALFEKNGVRAAGGFAATALVDGIRKPALFDTFCYTDPAHKKKFLELIRDSASVFDEIILDDFYFTSCRCKMCIKAKGSRSWSEFRRDLMNDFAKVVVKEAHEVNPNLKLIIKFPNWYESYQETGFDPEHQKEIFDGLYTGTETRTPHDPQHLQRYGSYSLMRLIENSAPGRNGGGWIDLGGSEENIGIVYEQAENTVLSHGKELTLWNFESFLNSSAVSLLGRSLNEVDRFIGTAGKPVGVRTWEPYNGDGEDQLYNYLGMCGLPIEPSPCFDGSTGTVFFTQSTAEDASSVETLKDFVLNGGNVVVTIGYFKEMYEKGIKDLTSVRLTGRHVSGSRYMIDNANYHERKTVDGNSPVLFEVLNYKNNASQADIILIAGEDNFPVMTEDNYGDGRFFILNVPENYADMYKLPSEVIQNINKHLSMGQRVYLGGKPKFSLFAYENNRYVIHTYDKCTDVINIIVRGESSGIRDLDTGRIYTDKICLIKPNHFESATTVIEEPEEFSYPVIVESGKSFKFEVL